MRKFTTPTLIASSLLLLFSNVAMSDDLSIEALMTKSANIFKQGCSEFISGNYTPAAMECFARVETFFDAIHSYNIPSSQTKICNPKGTNYGDFVRAINMYSFRVPSSYGAFGVLQTAAQLAYPCGPGRS